MQLYDRSDKYIIQESYCLVQFLLWIDIQLVAEF